MGCRTSQTRMPAGAALLHDFQEIQSPADGADLRKVARLSIHHCLRLSNPGSPEPHCPAGFASETFANDLFPRTAK